ncbi:MAG: FAD-binding oxidoreductase [bacterium]
MSRSSLLSRVVSRLREICGPNRVLTEQGKLLDYGHDEGPETPRLPDVVVKPVTVTEVAEIVRLAQEERVPLTPRGLGTGLAGGSVPVYGGIVISTDLMDRILEVDTENLMVRTQPGVRTVRIGEACAQYNLYYPVDPASLDDCSIGGNVATNAGGARAFKYGVTGDYVTGIQAVLADGTVINYGGKLRKNATGYDLNKLLIGSEGTLGIVTEITLRLVPKPRHQVDILIPLTKMRLGVELVLKLVQEKRFVPAVIEFMEKKAIQACAQIFQEDLPLQNAAVQILVEVEGNERETALDEALAVAEMAKRLGAEEPLIAENAASQARLWKIRRAIAKSLKQIYPEVVAQDIVVPPARLPETVEFLNELENRFATTIVPFGHIGDGNIHVDICQTGTARAGWRKRCEQILDELIDFVVKVGGQVTAEHGIGSLRRRFLKKGLTEAEIGVMERLKKTLDPDGILNPGKIFPES